MRILPVYLFVDTSASMAGEIARAEEGLTSLINTFSLSAAYADIRIAVVGFDDTATEILSLISPADAQIPGMHAGGGTNFANAFRLAKQIISRDMKSLRADGNSAFRPLLVFISDGAPMDASEWPNAFNELQSPNFREHPTIIAIGFGSADPSTMLHIGTGGAFAMSEDLSPGEALNEIFAGLTSMIGSTVISSTEKGGGTPMPIPPSWLNLGTILD